MLKPSAQVRNFQTAAAAAAVPQTQKEYKFEPAETNGEIECRKH